MKTIPVVVIVMTLWAPAWLRGGQASQATAPPQAARAEDVGTLEATIRTLYNVISGPAGQPRDWDRFRSLFLPGARLILAVSLPGEEPRVATLTVEDYVRRTRKIFEKEGFWESEKKRKTEAFGSIAHAFSTYESRREKGAKPFQHGVNSIQLFHDGKRWWIATVMWNSGRE